MSNQTGSVKKIYMTGICGVAMGTLAGMLKECGFSVRGSDHHIYPPMSDMLAKWGIECFDGFDASRIRKDETVIIGNAVSRGNPEAEYVLNERIPYLSMTEALYSYFLHDRDVVAVCGTHGKTTTTALLAHILKSAGLDPSCFVGGVMVNYESNFFLGSGKFFIIEGDEYDSAFFEKTPKFIRYRPTHALLTALEFDHADIYNNLDEITLWFKRLVNMIPGNGHIVYNKNYPALNDAVEKSFSRMLSFGSYGDVSWQFKGYEGDLDLLVLNKGELSLDLKSHLSGEFNYANICSAAAMALELGVTPASVQEGVRTFLGVKRRQELLFTDGTIRIIEDFAHHPTAIRAVLEMIKKKYHGSKIIALFEPRSATARRNIFQDSLPGSFSDADSVMIKTPYLQEKIPAGERLDAEKVCAEIRAAGKEAFLFGDTDAMVHALPSMIDRTRGTVIIVMSNGGFDGIYSKMISLLKA